MGKGLCTNYYLYVIQVSRDLAKGAPSGRKSFLCVERVETGSSLSTAPVNGVFITFGLEMEPDGEGWERVPRSLVQDGEDVVLWWKRLVCTGHLILQFM